MRSRSYHRKGQSALEFLTTYGWAFLVITVTIGSLYYFGVLDFSKYIPEQCIFPSQFRCLDFTIQEDSMRIKLINNIGEDVRFTTASVSNDADPPVSCSAPPGTSWDAGTALDVNFTSCTGGGVIQGERADIRVSFEYYAERSPSQTRHKVSGKIGGQVTP